MSFRPTHYPCGNVTPHEAHQHTDGPDGYFYSCPGKPASGGPAVAKCGHSGLTVEDCHRSDLCDCFDHPELDAIRGVPAVDPEVIEREVTLASLHQAASDLADLWHVPIDVFWQTRELHIGILRALVAALTEQPKEDEK